MRLEGTTTRIHSTRKLAYFLFFHLAVSGAFFSVLISFAPYHFPFPVDITKAKQKKNNPPHFLLGECNNNSMKIHIDSVSCICVRKRRSFTRPLLNNNKSFLLRASNKHSAMNNLLCVLERNNLLYFGVYCVCARERESARVYYHRNGNFIWPEYFSFHWKLGVLLIYNYDGGGKKTIGLYLYLHGQHRHCHRRTPHRHTHAPANTLCIVL